MSADTAGQTFRGTRGVHDISNHNQSWYRVTVSSIWLWDRSILISRDQPDPVWQGRLWWILTGMGVLLAGVFAWAMRHRGTKWNAGGEAGALAGLVWLAISLGKIAWNHFYVMMYPLTCVAWLVARRHGDGRDGRALKWMLRLMVVSCLMHYGVTSDNDTRAPASTRAQRAAKKMQVVAPHDLGGMLLPAGILALATVILASRRPQSVDCSMTSSESLAVSAQMAETAGSES